MVTMKTLNEEIEEHMPAFERAISDSFSAKSVLDFSPALSSLKEGVKTALDIAVVLFSTTPPERPRS